MSRKITVVNLAGYRLKWWERIALSVMPMEQWDGEYTVGRFKLFLDKMYIYSIRYHTNMKQYDNTLGRFN